MATKRVLVVDDDHECRLLLSTVVAQAGFAVDSAADGQMALTLVRSRMPDLVLLDAHLPGLDGFAACDAIKSDPKTEHIAVVILTAFATSEAQEKSKKAGADEFVSKPFRSETLLELIEQLLEIQAVAKQLDVGQGAMAKAFSSKE